MKIKKIDVRPYYRLLVSDLEGLDSNDRILISTDKDEFEYEVQVSDIKDRYEKGIGCPNGDISIHWNSPSIRGVSSTKGVPEWIKKKSISQMKLSSIRRTWFFQGNPDTFEMDKYLIESSEHIAWRVKKFSSEIQIGDEVYFWRAEGRSKKDAGIVARARVSSDLFKSTPHTEANLYWKNDQKKFEIVDMVKLELLEVSVDEGMIRKDSLKNLNLFKNSQIINSPRGTVFPITEEQSEYISEIWSSNVSWDKDCIENKGKENPRKKKTTTYQYERSLIVINQTIKRAKRLCEFPNCEIPLFKNIDGEFYVEVHHIQPLAKSGADKIKNTICLCPHHHREAHLGREMDKIITVLKDVRDKNP